MSTETIGSNKISIKTRSTKSEKIAWSEQQVNPTDIAPIRNKPDPVMNLDDEEVIIE